MLISNYMIYGELGCCTMDVNIKLRTISHWARLLTGKQSNLSFFILYKCMYDFSLGDNINFD